MQIFFTALISGIVSLGGMFLAYNYVPLDAVSVNVPQNLGSTITTILGTDTLSSSRAVINTNFSNLNTDKLESGSTASTLTIGTLTLTNPLGVAYGGTASTTISLNSVILGNGASGFKTVVGHGTSGQFLTSNGAGSAPTWQTSALDLAGNYGWTGNHNFAGTLTLLKNPIASTTLTFSNGGAGLAYVFPTTRQASSTVLTEDGSGNLRFITPSSYVLSANSANSVTTSSVATTTLDTLVIPANTITTSGVVDVRSIYKTSAGGTGCWVQVDIGNGSASTTVFAKAFGGDQMNFLQTNIMATSTSSVIVSSLMAPGGAPYSAGSTVIGQHQPLTLSTASAIYLAFRGRLESGNCTEGITFHSYNAVVRQIK